MSQKSWPDLRSDLREYGGARIESLRAVIDGTSRLLLGVSSLRALLPTFDNRHPSRELCQSQFLIDRQTEVTSGLSFRLMVMVVSEYIAVSPISLEMGGPRWPFRRASLGLCGTLFTRHA